MKTAYISIALALTLAAGPLAAQQSQPTLQLPPPTPAKAPAIPMPAPKATAPIIAPTVPAAAAAESSGVVAKAAAAPTKHKAAPSRKRKSSKPAEPKVPYADLPINQPARDALGISAAWVNNSGATVTSGADGRVVFTFGETMPTVVCAPLRICDIELQAGEKVSEQPHIGDDVRWSVSPGITGAGDQKTTHVIVKPTESGLDTNLFIPTDRRMYRLRLVSSEANYVSVVSFHYPRDEKAAWDMALAQAQVEDDKVVADLPATSVDALDFNYGVEVRKGKPRWVPVRVFADGTRTFIQLPEGTTNQDVPAVVEVTPDGGEQIVNFRFRGGYVVVDRVIQRAALLAGVGGSAERVEIERGCARRTFTGRCKG